MQKCTRKHHTLLHRDADSVPQEKHKNDKVEETHVAALTVREQVLLMTCKLNVTAADGSSTLARALIDAGSSVSYVHEQLAQHLRLPRKSRNVIVEGVAGRSSYTHTRFCMVPSVLRRRQFGGGRGRSIRAQEDH